MSDKPLMYVAGEVWWKTLGLTDYHGSSWTDGLKHIVSETSRVIREHGLDPDLPATGVRGDMQHLLAPYRQPLIWECVDAYVAAKACLRHPAASMHGFRLANLWWGQAQAAVAAPLLVQQSRTASQRKQAAIKGAAKKRAASAKLRERIESTQREPKKKGGKSYSPRHLQRLMKKK